MTASSIPLIANCDYLIVGAGAAGLSLAYRIAQEPALAAKRVVVVEPEAKDQNDRTWSFWTDEPSVFDEIVAHEWKKLAFRSPSFEKVFDLDKYRYCTIRGLRFYDFVRDALLNLPNQFSIVRGEVSSLENQEGRVAARLSTGQEITAQYAFDSRPPALQQQPEQYHYLLQHFVGWEIETTHDVFDPSVVEFMDFRGEQHQEARFIYVLPFSPRRALVEYTLFSAHPLPKAAYEEQITQYLKNTLGLRVHQYRIVEQEVGAIPMTNHPLPLQIGAHIINIGTRSGRAKPSTGYAFQRIQMQSKQLVEALASRGQLPANLVGDPWQFRLFDTLLLDIMQRKGEMTRDIFTKLFQHNPVERILRFLDERTNGLDNLRIMNSVDAKPFLYSISQVLRNRVSRRHT